MTDDQVSRTIDELERALAREVIAGVEQGLARDDPAFVRRFHNRCRTEFALAVLVFLLLATGAVFLAVGLATHSWPAWVGGVLAFRASFGANALHERTLRA
jgi:Protein of unknown function (DUF3040)